MSLLANTWWRVGRQGRSTECLFLVLLPISGRTHFSPAIGCLRAACSAQAAAPSTVPRCPSLSRANWKHEPANSQQHKGFCFILHGTPAPALRAKVLYIATVMVTKLPGANTNSLSVWWGWTFLGVKWREFCSHAHYWILHRNCRQGCQLTLIGIFFIGGHVSIRNLIDRLRQVTHFAVTIKLPLYHLGFFKRKIQQTSPAAIKAKEFCHHCRREFYLWMLDVWPRGKYCIALQYVYPERTPCWIKI